MKTINSIRYTLYIGVTTALLSGCALQQPQGVMQPSAGAFGAAEPGFTIPHILRPAMRVDRGKSWMRPEKEKNAPLLYVGDWNTNDVYVYDFRSGRNVGMLTGFTEPYGMCVDAKGNVYITNFGGGTLVEYAYGASKPLRTYLPGGAPIGCSVSAKGDVSVTSFSPGAITVYTGGNPRNGATYTNTNCDPLWPVGYDDKGNLIGIGEVNSSISVCALLASSKSETTLTDSGITIYFPGGTSWDGEYIALGDQTAGGIDETGVWPSTLSGTTITPATAEVVFKDICDGEYSDILSPFFLGKNFGPITPRSKQRAEYMVGTNRSCDRAGYSQVGIWDYPSGKIKRSIYLTIQAPYGAAVSVGK